MKEGGGGQLRAAQLGGGASGVCNHPCGSQLDTHWQAMENSRGWMSVVAALEMQVHSGSNVHRGRMEHHDGPKNRHGNLFFDVVWVCPNDLPRDESSA